MNRTRRTRYYWLLWADATRGWRRAYYLLRAWLAGGDE